MSILTHRCFGIDWEQISDISSFYQLPVPSYRELKGKSEYTIRSELGGESALLRKINGMNESDIWKEKDIVYFLSNEISWPTITIQDEIISNPSFSFLSHLSPYDQAYIALRLLFSIRTPFFEEEFIKLYSQICKEEVTIGVQMRLTERRYNADDEYLISECFIPEMINSCLSMLKGNEKKKSCAFFVASDIPPSDIRSYFFDHMKEKLDLFVEKKRVNLKYRIILNSLTSHHLDNFRFLYYLFGYYNIREFLGTFLDWEMLKWMDMLLISESGFSQTIFWYSGVQTKILKLLPNGKCIFPYALKDGYLYNVSL
jgi:hypothetical protein